MTEEATNPVEEPEVEELSEEEEQLEIEGGEAEEGEAHAATEPEEIELEYEGQKYKVHPALKDGILRQADYTRKTQELAETRKALETTLQRAEEVSQKERTLQAQIDVNAEAIAEYQKIDWQRWVEVDPQAANKARIAYDDLFRGQETIKAQLTEATNERLAMRQQETAKRLAEGQKVLAEQIPGWGKEKAEAILSFGQEAYGLSADELREIDDPRAIVILHDAMEYRNAQKTAATVKKVEQQQAIKPAVTVRGGGKVNRGLTDDLPIEEWAKRRNAQVAKRSKG